MRQAMHVRIEHGRRVEEQAFVVSKMRKSLQGVGNRVTTTEVGDDQRHVGVFSPDFPDFRDIGRVSQPVRLGHVQRHPGAPLVEHFKLVMWKKIKNAGLKISVAAGWIVADQRIIHLHAEHARLIQLLGDSIRRPLRQHDGQAAPAPPHAFGLKIGVFAFDVEIQADRSEAEAGNLASGEHQALTSLGVGRADRLHDLVDPVLPSFFFAHGCDAKMRLRDVRMGVEDALRQPRLKMFEPKGSIDVGIRPNMMQRNRVHSLESRCVEGLSSRKYSCSVSR